MIALRRMLALSALSTLVVAAAPAVGGAQTSSVTSVVGSADGLFVDLELDFDEPGVVQPEQVVFSFGPAPRVTLPPEGGEVTDEIVDLSEDIVEGVTLSASRLSVAAEGELGPDGYANAETTVENLLLFDEEDDENGNDVQVLQEGEDVLSADSITATCVADPTDGVSGDSELVNAQFGSFAFEENPAPNTVLEPVQGITFILNAQEENADGSLSISPLVILLDFQDEGESVLFALEVGPATCGVALDTDPGADDLEPAPAEPVRSAPSFTG